MYSKKTLLLFVSLLIFCVALIVLGLLTVFSPPEKPKPLSSSPTSQTSLQNNTKEVQSNYPSDQYLTGMERIHNSKGEKEASKKSASIISFRSSLPYKTKTFLLSYEIETNTYIAVLSAANKQQAEQDLQDYFARFNLEETAVTLTITYK